MRRQVIVLLICLIATNAFTQGDWWGDDEYNRLNFRSGEEFEFKLSYGWFTVGQASLKLSEASYEEKNCFKVDIAGGTAGLLGVFTNVNDSWGGYVEKSDMLPVMAYADIQEGKYIRKEQILFNKQTGQITVDMVKKKGPKPTRYYEFESEMHDMMSGYLHLRSIDYNNLQIGDTVKFQAFYDEIFYDFGVIYQGKELLKSKVGKLMAHKIVPVLPENDIFPGESPITAWLSADRNQLPLKIEANMFFGSAHCDLTNYKNIKYGPDYQ